MTTNNLNLNIETLRWRDNKLEMIDQRILPESFHYVAYDSAASVAEGIRQMVVRGAPAIGVAAAYGIALEAIRLQQEAATIFQAALEEGFKVLSTSRPTAVNLFWALKRMRRTWEHSLKTDPAAIAQALLSEAHSVFHEDIQSNRTIGAYGAELLADNSAVLTHCNAGALATAGHGTALGVMRSAVESGKKISVFVDETRPFLQGARLTAWEMVQEKIPTTLISDNMAGYMMNTGEIDAVIVGADRVAANGDVANKIGTYMVAVMAKRHNIPFYVACPLSTIDLEVGQGSEIPIEERPGDEVKGFRGNRWAAAGVKIRNPAFDITPADLVTALITEKGVVLEPDRDKLQALF